MDTKLKKWEISLIIALAAALLMGAVSAGAQTELTDKLVRLHVIANSDSETDQALKLEVRDRVQEYMAQPLAGVTDAQQAMEVIESHVADLQAHLEDYLAGEGIDEWVTVELREAYGFPTRQYDDFALPAGRYKALRVVLGEGMGQNWWCVVFPPLCAAAATQVLEDPPQETGLTEDDWGLMTQENEGYVIRFKTLEWLGNLRNWLAG